MRDVPRPGNVIRAARRADPPVRSTTRSWSPATDSSTRASVLTTSGSSTPASWTLVLETSGVAGVGAPGAASGGAAVVASPAEDRLAASGTAWEVAMSGTLGPERV
jgi:hypothetical protein